jgi:hypothetical protein
VRREILEVSRTASAFPENVEGPIFVDATCIDCDTCRQLAPTVFGETGDFSFVKLQAARSRRRTRGVVRAGGLPHRIDRHVREKARGRSGCRVSAWYRSPHAPAYADSAPGPVRFLPFLIMILARSDKRRMSVPLMPLVFELLRSLHAH